MEIMEGGECCSGPALALWGMRSMARLPVPPKVWLGRGFSVAQHGKTAGTLHHALDLANLGMPQVVPGGAGRCQKHCGHPSRHGQRGRSEEQAGRRREPQNVGLNPKLRQDGAGPGTTAQRGKATAPWGDSKDTKTIASAPGEGKAESKRSQGKG